MAAYVDAVEFADGEPAAEMRDYLQSEFTDGWAVWRWSDETVRIPTHRIKSVTTSEE